MNQSDILEYIRGAAQPLTKRELARAFKLKGSGPRVALKKILKALEDEGAISKFPGGGYGVPEGLPSVCVLEVSDIDLDGDVLARPVDWKPQGDTPLPRIEIMPDNKGHPALTTGDRVLARLKRIEGGIYEARTIKRLDLEDNRITGMIRRHKRGSVLVPADKKQRYEFDIAQEDLGGAQDGDLCLAEIKPQRGQKNKQARIVKVLGARDDPKAISLISLSEAGLHEEFPDAVIKATKGLEVPPIKGREDLRTVPLVTIDGADARDFDDAVYAEPTGDGGFHLIVAIADVAYYVRPGAPLDKEAEKRGNSTYFPDRVVPMLPEALSNDLCSLRPDEDRACMAMHLWIDKDGQLQKYKIVRGLMRSAARLIYEQVQHLHDTGYDGDDKLKNIIEPLYAAYALLDKARRKRGALDLDLPEREIVIDDKGNMTGVKTRQRVDAHKLIEEFMILANVAAARALEDRKAPCVYRVHERPSMDKLDSVREFVEGFGLSMPKGQVIKPAQINQVLRKAAELPYTHLISQVILRSQNQAVYSPDNQGHFGLALAKYAHFTSPIRRYADLIVHRSLISAYGLGPGGLDERGEARMAEVCQHISSTERTSMEAERNAVDRFTAAFLSEHIGATYTGRINGVTRFGLFVTLDESGADGLVPMKSLRKDFFVHDEQAHALIGRKTRIVYRLGAEVRVKLKEADGLTGSCVLELTGESLNGADIPGLTLPSSQGRTGQGRSGHGRSKGPKRGGEPKKKHQKNSKGKLDKPRKKKHKAKSRK